MKAVFGWVWAGDAAPGPYSTTTPLMLLPGMLGMGRSNTTVTLPGGGSAAEAALIESTAKTAAISNRVTMGFLLDSWEIQGGDPLLRCRPCQPVVEANRAQTCVLAGDQRLVIEYGAEVARMHVRHDLAVVPGRPQIAPGQFVDRHGFRTADFN